MSWDLRSLDSLLDKSGTDRAGIHDLPVLSITMRDGLIDQSNKFKKRIASQDTTKYRIAYRNELVVGFPIDEGVLGFQTKYPAGMVSPAYDIWKLKAPKETHISYLERYLRSSQARRIYASKMQGAVARRRSLTKEDFLGLGIPFPPLDAQKRIAHLLGNVEGLIARRKRHLQQLDDLLKSVFLEMFGDPVRNEKRWDVEPCGKVVLDISSGTSYGGEDREFVSPDEIGVLKISSVTKGIFDPAEYKVVDPSRIKKSPRFVKRGDFLFSRANTYELVGACCIVPRDYGQLFLPDKLWVMTINHDLVNPQFFNFLLKNDIYRGVVRSLSSGGHESMLNISMKRFMTLDIPCPPIGLQNQFAAIVEKIEAIKARYQRSLCDMESLYGVLSQKAFKGELNLSRVPLPIENDESEEPDKDRHDGVYVRPIGGFLGGFQEYPLSNIESRREFVKQAFDAYLEHLGEGSELSFDRFWEQLTLHAQDYVEEDDLPFNSQDYDLVKQLVFEALERGELTQTRNPIETGHGIDYGNRIILTRMR